MMCAIRRYAFAEQNLVFLEAEREQQPAFCDRIVVAPAGAGWHAASAAYALAEAMSWKEGLERKATDSRADSTA